MYDLWAYNLTNWVEQKEEQPHIILHIRINKKVELSLCLEKLWFCWWNVIEKVE